MVRNYHNQIIMFELRSKTEQALISYFLINPAQEHYINELAALLSLDPSNTHKKLTALEAQGFLTSRTQGKVKFFRLNKQYRLLPELKKTFNSRYGLAEQLKKELAQVPGIEQAYIFGSFAQNKMNKDSDIDLLIVGTHSIMQAQKRISPIQNQIGREINVIDMSPAEFKQRQKRNDAFILNVLSNKNIKLV